MLAFMYKGKARINRKYINLKTLQEKRREEMNTHHSHPIIQKKKHCKSNIECSSASKVGWFYLSKVHMRHSGIAPTTPPHALASPKKLQTNIRQNSITFKHRCNE